MTVKISEKNTKNEILEGATGASRNEREDNKAMTQDNRKI